MSKKKIIVGLVSLVAIGAGVGAFLFFNRGPEMWSMEWKKEQYGPSCEAAKNSGRGMSTNTTEYTVCTRDLGYDIKGIEPDYGNSDSSSSNEQPSQSNSSNSSSGSTQPSQDTSSDTDKELKEAQRVGCATLRAISLEDYIESNKANGISEADSRIVYKAGIAQCEAQGF
jgi:hypothetical protein